MDTDRIREEGSKVKRNGIGSVRLQKWTENVGKEVVGDKGERRAEFDRKKPPYFTNGRGEQAEQHRSPTPLAHNIW